MTPYFQQDGITIYHGDCREVLPTLRGSFDGLVSDPPYGMTYTNDAKKGLRGDSQRQGIRQVRSVCMDLDRLLNETAVVLLFCHWESWPDFYDAVASYWNVKNALVWHKDAGGPGDCLSDFAHDYEMVLYATKGRPKLQGGRDGAVYRCLPVPGAHRVHPTEKPLALMSYYVGKVAAKGHAILDPFMGVGTTLRAAKRLGCSAVGIELDEKYCEIAASRLGQREFGWDDA